MNDDTNDNPQPKIAQTGPYAVELESGKPYFWCFCGRSANQPFCDTAHVESDFAPAPFCDTTHESLGG